MSKNRDDFDPKVVDTLSRRASFICSNPDCRALAIAPSNEDTSKAIYIGVAAHITAAAEGGPRYDPNLTPDQRASIENGIFLCSSCSVMIDKNGGIDFPTNLLHQWKRNHEQWVREHLNKSVESQITIVDGEHKAKGIGNVTGLEIKKSAIIKPGTKVSAEGIGNVTGTKIG
ncbi:MAG: hypothetical protein ABSC53_03780 [Bacteroidota bacterium]|jgi:hypothetical protein